MFFIDALSLVSFFFGESRQFELLRWDVVVRGEFFLFGIGIFEVLLFVSREVILVEELSIFDDILKVFLQIDFFHFYFFFCQNTLFRLCICLQIVFKRHFALILEAHL